MCHAELYLTKLLPTSLSEHSAKTWYMHFSVGASLICVVSKFFTDKMLIPICTC